MSLAHAVYRERLCRLHYGYIELCASRVASRHIFSHATFSVTFSYGLYTTHAPQEFSPAQVGKS